MARIAIFDSGLGSLSIIKEIQKVCRNEIIYFADQKNYPYGKKSQVQLRKIMSKSINLLKKFSPDLIVIASNTPSLMLNLSTKNILDVKPPLKEAIKISKSNQIGILGTESAIKSKGLSQYIKKNNLMKSVKIFKIDGSNLVELVESGKFLTDTKFCKNVIKKELDILLQESIDVVTLSSTHLPFLKKILEKEFPNIQFVDPGNIVAQKILKKIKFKQSNRNSLKIFSSGDSIDFQNKLNKIGIKNKVNFLTF